LINLDEFKLATRDFDKEKLQMNAYIKNINILTIDISE